ncbi:MAG TPA: protease inhibitor I42 family protein, partial [Bacteroidia bacterium]|nr:protease inhibitor I42 family protein [Bacteroidia bacterium]
MKKTNYFYLTLILIAFSFSNVFGQGFVKIDKEQAGKQISITQNEVLEVQLPSNPSSGYVWSLQNNNNQVVEQVGDWEFVSDRPDQPIGASGKQIMRFVSKTAGT